MNNSVSKQKDTPRPVVHPAGCAPSPAAFSVFTPMADTAQKDAIDHLVCPLLSGNSSRCSTWFSPEEVTELRNQIDYAFASMFCIVLQSAVVFLTDFYVMEVFCLSIAIFRQNRSQELDTAENPTPPLHKAD